jgi:hypothetical protein
MALLAVMSSKAPKGQLLKASAVRVPERQESDRRETFRRSQPDQHQRFTRKRYIFQEARH